MGVSQCSEEPCREIYLWYVLATLGTTYTLLIAIVFGLLHNTMACLQKNRNLQLNK